MAAAMEVEMEVAAMETVSTEEETGVTEVVAAVRMVVEKEGALRAVEAWAEGEAPAVH